MMMVMVVAVRLLGQQRRVASFWAELYNKLLRQSDAVQGQPGHSTHLRAPLPAPRLRFGHGLIPLCLPPAHFLATKCCVVMRMIVLVVVSIARLVVVTHPVVFCSGLRLRALKGRQTCSVTRLAAKLLQRARVCSIKAVNSCCECLTRL
jgi:hypothetical protein